MNAIISDVIGLGTLGLVWARFSGIELPLINTDRAALIAVAVLGFTMCALAGATRAIGPLGFAHPLTIVGTVLGVVTLAIVVIAVSGRVASIDDRTAIVALVGMIALKWIIDLVYGLVVGFPKAAAT